MIEVLNGHYALKLQEVETTTSSGIVLSQTQNAGQKKTTGKVVAIPTDNRVGLAVGDTVVIAAQGGCQDVQVGAETVQVVSGDDIIAKLQ